MKRSIFVLTLAAVCANAFAPTFFFFGQDANTSVGDPFPNSAMQQRNWMAVAGSMSSISSLSYERDPIGAGGAFAYSPLPGVTISMTNVTGASGVNGLDQAELGWNTTPLGSQHLRFAPDFNANPATITFSFNSLINSFSTLYMGAQDNFAGDFSLEGWRNGNQVFGMGQGKPTPNGTITSHAHYGYTTDDPNGFIDEIRFVSRGDRTNGSDHVGLDDTMFTYCNPVPEPATMAALGIGALALLRRRRK